MTSRWRQALLALVLVAVVFGVLIVINPRPWPKPLSNLEVAQAWLECTDCRGPYLKRLVEMRATNTDTVTKFLVSALNGPDRARQIRHEQDLMRLWLADSAYRNRHGEPARPDSLRIAYIARYDSNFNVMWRSRAAIALGVIRNDAAMAALASALNFQPTNYRDSALHDGIERAVADSGRKVLAHYP
jgi:hypothetical protein